MLQKMFLPAHLRGLGVSAPHAALPAAPDPPLLRALRRTESPRKTTRATSKTPQLFLHGRQSEVLADLERQDAAYAAELKFEQAACDARPDSGAVARTAPAKHARVPAATPTSTSPPSSCTAGAACVNLAMVRGGRHLGDTSLFPEQRRSGDATADEASTEVLKAFLAQHYLDKCSSRRPSWSNVEFDEPEIEVALAEQCRARGATGVPAAGAAPHLAGNGAQETPRLALARACCTEQGSQEARTPRCAMRWASISPNIDVLRIECFDISHTQGEATVASCVVFHRPRDAEWRIPALQHRRHHARRRLCRDARRC